MRVLFFSSIFPRPYLPNRGIYCFHVCKALAAAGHAVRVVSPRPWLERPNSKQWGDALPGLSEMNVDYPPYFYTPRVLRRAYGWFMRASVGSRLRQVMAEFSPDCVISYWAHPDGQVATRAAHEAGVPSAVMVGGSDVLVLAQQTGARRRKIVSVLERADAVVAVSAHMRDQLVEFGVPAYKVHVVYRGVDGDLFSPGDAAAARSRLGIPAEGKTIVCVGNLVPVKGVDVLLDAAAQLRSRGANFRLHLIGDGASRPALEAQARTLGLSESVTFQGAVAQRHLPDWYRAADLTALPSRSEGIPNVLRESMACGTPWVATRVGGTHEIAGDPANTLVPPENPAALATAIEAALARPRPATLGSDNASTWADSVEKLLTIMRPLVAASKRSASTPNTLLPTAADPR